MTNWDRMVVSPMNLSFRKQAVHLLNTRLIGNCTMKMNTMVITTRLDMPLAMCMLFSS